MSILENTNRNGNFTSSNIWKLMEVSKDGKSFGKPALTYIQEKAWERKLKRSIETGGDSKETIWGKFLEPFVHDLLTIDYIHSNDETLTHPEIPFWKGSPDFKNLKYSVVSDSKCPQPKAFCKLVDSCNKGLSYFRDEFPEYYWQLVSNACITESKYIEIIIYMPYEKDLNEIRDAADNYDGLDQYKYRFISELPSYNLACLPNDSEYKDLNIFRWDVFDGDRDKLKENVLKANELLLKI